ncbi:MAG: four helix bundle protein [Chloroflexi bacterium]|nr:four helix bundle protein [Chloroflexota bacterium]MBM3172827.1 four helix bundle protein [Chloroflexota bacterium]MBM3174860.1 four helix bundle protein [Chloroflexota bacterium]MBM4450903.1 four helix bundle protein [Chloroflexota bacterium]
MPGAVPWCRDTHLFLHRQRRQGHKQVRGVSRETRRQQAIGVRQQAIVSYKDLVVWQKSMDLVELVYRITEKLPASERWGLTSQMRKAAVSVPSNIAEGYGRKATGEYRHHLSISRASLLELETQVILSQRLSYLKQHEAGAVLNQIQEISKMLSSLVSKIK